MNPVDYQKLFRQLPENLMLMTPDAVIVDNTDGHVAVSLKPRAEVLGRSMFDAFPAVDQNQDDIIYASHEHVRRHRQPHTMPVIRYDLEVPAERGGGFEPMYWQATHFPILDDQGELLYILQKTENITEQYLAEQQQRLMEQALAENRDRTDFILQSLPALIWTAAPDGSRDFFNQRWLDFTGQPAAALTGQQWLSCVHPDDQARVRQAWDHAIASGDVYQVEYRLRRHDGQYRWVLVRALPRREPGSAITMWVGCGFDLHDQKQMVQELLEANEQQAALSDQAYQALQLARSQREMFYSLFQQAPALIVILRGPTHVFDFVNPQALQLFGSRAVAGRPVAEAVPEVVEQGFVALLDQVYATGEPFHGREIEVLLDRTGTGTLTSGYFNFTYQLFHEAGQKAGITIFAYEITDLVQARQALEHRGESPTSA